jgi:asparagine synthase (glutamine-hydrolysing)
MCGIAGVIAWDERYRVTRETLSRMSARIAHRGPDGEGFYLNHEQKVTQAAPQCGFAFRRLAILDPDPRAMQPFTIGDKTIVFNGEIYNFRDLRAELTNLRPDYPWRTTGDTEVLLLAYDVWGEKCPEHLNGMFAFAVWDEREKSLFLARDRMGQKPLYICDSDDVVAFASEISALRQLPWVDWRPAERGLLEYLRYGCTDWFHEGCDQELPGWTRTYSATKRPHRTRYFHPEAASAERSATASADVRSLVVRAVSRQLVSDVPVGVFLSGGVDSSVIAAAARQHGPVQTFSIGFDDARYDETSYAAQVARHLGTKHHVFHVRPDAAEDLPKLARAFGEPFADSSALPTHYLARETRQHVKVALSGDGGDELFGGYDRYKAMRLADRLRALTLLGAVGARVARGHPKSRVTRAGRLLASLHLPPALRYDAYVRIFDDPTISQLWRQPADPPGVARHFAVEFGRHQDPVRAAMAVDRTAYLPDDLLTKVDRASMLHGLEVRSPFMDHELVQLAAGLTTDQLLKGGPKRMLREAFKDDLPAWVFKRKKMGFAVPIGEWFRGELRPMLRDNLFAADSFARQHFDMKVVQRLVDEHERQKVDHSQRLYALLMLELWWRTSR